MGGSKISRRVQLSRNCNVTLLLSILFGTMRSGNGPLNEVIMILIAKGGHD